MPTADTFGVFRKTDIGVEFAIHQTKKFLTDRTDPHSFAIIGERMPAVMKRNYKYNIHILNKISATVFFWNNREKDWNCFNPGASMRSSSFTRALKTNTNIERQGLKM